MPVHTSSTAILIFSRTASNEAAVKQFDWHGGKKGNQRIAQYLIEKTVHTARQSGLPIFLHYDTETADTTFGERLADAMERIYQQGFLKVIVIGNDSPELTPEVLTNASRALEQAAYVFGPATDGGVYLIGLSRTHYDREAFVRLPWQTNQLQAALHAAAPFNKEAACWLDTLHDIDNSRDFKGLLRRLLGNNPLKRDLIGLIAAYQPSIPLYNAPITASPGVGMNAPFRGPPA